MNFESENIEYKSKLTNDIYKEIIAFANTNGGIIYIGIDDNRNIIGIEDIDDTYTRLTNGVRDSINPDITMCIKYTLQDNNVIRININEGSYKPYYLKSKGIKPSGVYIRQGASSVPASFEQIRQMIKASDGDVFETMRSIEQTLTFSSASRIFKKYHIDFEQDKFITLGLRNLRDDFYTNLALIISDECKHTTKIAVFEDDANTKFIDSKEFKGSVFEQLEDTYNYLMLCNHTTSHIQGLERIDNQEYPKEAIREALLNALVHRDYTFSGSIIINVNHSFIEFISIGGLLPPLLKEDILSGISQQRNPRLADIFHRLRLIESYGTGIRKIFSFYENYNNKPKIEITPNTFKIILPNMNLDLKTNVEIKKENKPQISFQMKLILEYINEYGEICDEDIQELLNIKRTRAYLIARQLIEAGLIIKIGKGTNKKYRINN